MFKLDDDLSSNFSSQHGDSEGGMDSAVDKYLKSHQYMLPNSHQPDELQTSIQDSPIPEQLVEVTHHTYIAPPSQHSQVEANIPEHLVQPQEEEEVGSRHTYTPKPPLQIETNIPEHITNDSTTHHTYTTDSQQVLDTHISDHITTAPLSTTTTKTLKATTISDVSAMVEMMMLVAAQGDATAYDHDYYQDDLDYIDYLSSHGKHPHHTNGDEGDSTIAAGDTTTVVVEEDEEEGQGEYEYDEDFLPYDSNTYDPSKLRILKKSIKERRWANISQWYFHVQYVCIYVFLYVCIYGNNVCMQHKYLCRPITPLCTYVYTRACMYVCMYVYRMHMQSTNV